MAALPQRAPVAPGSAPGVATWGGTPPAQQPTQPAPGRFTPYTQGMTTGMPAQAPIPLSQQTQAQQMTRPGAPNAAANPITNAPPGEAFGPGYGETYGKEHIGAYDKPTDFETFAQQQLQGNNPYYDRLRQQGMDAINQQMIARGHGNSGGALAALGNFQGALGAAQFNDMANLLSNASNMGLNRVGAGMSAASGIQGLQQQRNQQQFNQASDIAHLGAGLYGGFYGQGGQFSGDAAMAGINAGANASQLKGQGQQAYQNQIYGLAPLVFGG